MNTSFDPTRSGEHVWRIRNVGRERLERCIRRNDRTRHPTTTRTGSRISTKVCPCALDNDRPRLRPTSCGWTGRCGSPPCRHPSEYPWTLHLVWKLLHNDPGAVGLFADNPFPDKPPRYIRAVLYRYRFAPPGNPEGRWWKRERVGARAGCPPCPPTIRACIEFLKRAGWIPEK